MVGGYQLVVKIIIEEGIRTITDGEAEKLENEIRDELSITTENILEF